MNTDPKTTLETQTQIGENVVALIKLPMPVKELNTIIKRIEIGHGPNLRVMEEPKGWLQFFKP